MAELLNPDRMAAKAQSFFDDGQYDKAAQLFKAMDGSFKTSGDHLSAAEMANNQSVALLQAGDAQSALNVLDGRESVFERAGDIRRLAMTWGNRGSALDALNKSEEAIEAYTNSAELFKQIGENELFLTTMRSLSELQLRSRRPIEAVTTMQIGLLSIEKPSFGQRLLKRLFDIPFRLMNR